MDDQGSAVKKVNALGAVWSPDFDAYAAGQIDASAVRCVLCTHAPCDCPPFGSREYLAQLDRLHGGNRAGATWSSAEDAERDLHQAYADMQRRADER